MLHRFLENRRQRQQETEPMCRYSPPPSRLWSISCRVRLWSPIRLCRHGSRHHPRSCCRRGLMRGPTPVPAHWPLNMLPIFSLSEPRRPMGRGCVRTPWRQMVYSQCAVRSFGRWLAVAQEEVDAGERGNGDDCECYYEHEEG